MQDVPVKPFMIGAVFASGLWGLLIFALNFESKTQSQSTLDPRFEVHEASVTENQRLWDTQEKRTILWTPGNPKNLVTEIREVEPGVWEVRLKKIY